ncbi:hypothetical protein FQZ97_345090 [compost metagenome]
MLDGTGDAHGDVQVGGDDLAGLAHLHIVGREAGVDGGTGGAHSRAELVGQLFQQGEVLAVAHAAATGDHYAGGGEFGALRLRQLFLDEACIAGIVNAVEGFDARAAAGRLGRCEAGAADRDHLDAFCALHGSDGVAGIDRAFEGVAVDHCGDVGHLGHVQLRSNARHEVLAVGGGRGQDVAVVGCQFGDQRRDVLGQLVGISRIVGLQHPAYADDLGRGLCGRAAVVAGDQQVDIATDLACRGNDIEGRALERRVVVFCNYQDAHVQITFASFFSFATSSSTLATMMPPLR